jgi:hypothetical protein
MTGQSEKEGSIDLIYAELKDLIDYQAGRVINLNERIGWLLVFSALSASTLMVSSFAAFRAETVGQSSAPDWWLNLYILDIFLYWLVIAIGYLGQRIVVKFVNLEKEVDKADILSQSPVHVKKWLLETQSSIYSENERLVAKKTRYLSYAYLSLVVAVAFLVVIVVTATAPIIIHFGLLTF